MVSWDAFDIVFVGSAFFLQVVLIIHFTLRKWRFDTAIRYGPIVYLMSIPYALFSLLSLTAGRSWTFWLGGFLFLAWAIFGYTVEYIHKIDWRTSLRWAILGPYVVLYLATIMFYWWPLARISKHLLYGYAVLYIISTVLNVISHKRSKVQTLSV